MTDVSTAEMVAPNGAQVTVPAGMVRLFVAAGYREAGAVKPATKSTKSARAAE